jgi:hypothetical protein
MIIDERCIPEAARYAILLLIIILILIAVGIRY